MGVFSLCKMVQPHANDARSDNRASPVQGQPTAMQVDTALSPIPTVRRLMSSTHLSQLNYYTDSQQVNNFSAVLVYDESTVIDKI